MRILTSRWREGYLDYARIPGEVRVKVVVWANLERLEGLYFVRRPDLRTVLSYLRAVGLLALLRKARSRRAEADRNEKFLACGVGDVLEADADSVYARGVRVVFVAPCHPRCVERVVVPEILVKPVECHELLAAGSADQLEVMGALEQPCSQSLGVLRGWSAYAGIPLEWDATRETLACLEKALGRWVAAGSRTAKRLPADDASPVVERVQAVVGQNQGRLTAVLFGYGHYAKTVILPNLGHRIRLVKVHEIDPVQLGPRERWRIGIDTAPWPREEEQFGVYLIAGFHHTHAAIAAVAMEQGATAVVEKPVATSFTQLQQLTRALACSPGRLFVGFQRRYCTFNALAQADLGVSPGEPVCYRCRVDEEPLPPGHWYQWPASRGRLTSNGCHWIDHFLFINGFCGIADGAATANPGGDVDVRLRLQNGATFEMLLTDGASSRTGMQNTIELRARGTTVRVVNDSVYRAERTGRTLRLVRADGLAAHREMYRRISRRILDGAPGDVGCGALESTRVVLELEDMLVVGTPRKYA